MHTKTDILSIPVAAVTYLDALRYIHTTIVRGQKTYICVAAVHLLMECQSNNALRKGVAQAGLITPDGMPLVWISKWYGKKAIERVYGPTLMRITCEYARRRQATIFLVGGAVGQTATLTRQLEIQFPGIRIVGAVDTPERPLPTAHNAAIIASINQTKPDIVFVGLGCPLQEAWMITNRNNISAPVLIGVGAAFDFLTGRVRQAPPIMQRAGFEWFYRLMQDPRRLAQRYTITNARFIVLLLKQLFRDSWHYFYRNA